MLDPASLDLGYLAQFLGDAVNAEVLKALGNARLKVSHGYVVQHLLGGPRSIGELAGLLGVTQQAVSKTVREMGPLVKPAPSDDRREHRVALSARGLATVQATRAHRQGLDRRLRKRLGDRRVDAARALLLEALELLGGLDDVRHRRVRRPS
ncbi:MAG: MarR family transcriptional regulator [Myxococcaceae bacterium]|nr:MarR family transcriptional regulator [Myxococcaceae bacterium]